MAKLLLADDSVTIRKVVELTFAEEGIEVVSAADGDAAMQKFVETQPDIVLVDVEMPGQNGYKICEMIKQDEATRTIPVLLLVGSFEPFDQTEAERVGADGFLTKPFHSIRDLVAKVNELLAPPISRTTHFVDDDIDLLYKNSFAETVPLHDEETDEDPLRDSSMDDEMVETVQPAASYLDNGSGDAIAMAETVQSTIGSLGVLPAETEATDSLASSYDYLDPAIHDSKADTEEISSPFSSPAGEDVQTEVPAEQSSSDQEPSEEMIAMIAKRVVEKLSDRVVREIAQDAVPRIAEKLIREALEEEKKG